MRTKADLRRGQQSLITELYENDGRLAILPMGGGKTAASQTAISELIDDRVIRCGLVLAPKRVAQLVWTKEHLDWEHLKHLVIEHVAGSPAERLNSLFDPVIRALTDIYVVGIDNTQWLVEQLAKLDDDDPLFDLLLIDEISKFKAPRGKRGRALMEQIVRFKIIWGMTGTPRPNGYIDMFRPIKIVSKGQTWNQSFDVWRNRRFESDYAGLKWTMRPEWLDRTLEDIAQWTVVGDDSDMPKHEPVPVFHWVDLPPAAQKKYKQMEKDLFARIHTPEGILAANKAVATGKLAQAAQGFMYNERKEVEHLHTEKADMLVDLVGALDGYPALVCYEFIEDLDVLKNLWPGLPYFGNGISDKKAAENELRWNRGDIPLLGIHPASAAHGLNLQFGGNQFIFYGLPWSPELYDQVLRRIARPGQKHTVYAHYILARNTVDEIKYARLVDRLSEQEAFKRYMRKV